MFITQNATIENGSLVFLYANPRMMFSITVEANKVFDHKWGRFEHNKMIGQAYGTQMYSHTGKGSFYLLHPSCERWTLSLPHRTQIIYVADIGMIINLLEVQPGHRIVESGTGSASLTHAFARAVAPMGHVFTFEYHSERANQATQELKVHGLSDVVTVTHGNAYTDGFLKPELYGSIHAVFLDLPEPWKAVPLTTNFFIPSRECRICCFSPCIEQVQKTRASLVDNGFTNVQTIECLQTQWSAKMIDNPSIGAKVVKGKKRTREGETSDDSQVLVSHIPFREGKGHTAFLTFASYLPDICPR